MVDAIVDRRRRSGRPLDTAVPGDEWADGILTCADLDPGRLIKQREPSMCDIGHVDAEAAIDKKYEHDRRYGEPNREIKNANN